MTTGPRVTVLVPVYNRARFIGRAIESVLGQSFGDFELLLVDDGSIDDSVAVIRRYSDPRIRLIENGLNRGIPLTRSIGIAEARGRYIAMLDSDDEAPAFRLERQVAVLDRHADIAVVGGWAREIDAQGQRRGGVKMLPLAPNELEARLLFRTCHHHSSTMARAAVLREHGYRGAFPVCEDYDLFSRIAERHRLANLPRVLLHRRIHPGRITCDRAAQVRANNVAIARRRVAALGLPDDDATIAHHVLLARLKKERVTPDRDFLESASAWLERVAAANDKAEIYCPRGLAATLGQLWAIACLQARPAIGAAAFARFRSSPLRDAVPASLRANIAFALGKRGPSSRYEAPLAAPLLTAEAIAPMPSPVT
ncbi:MAG: glycosyltransferase [Sphingomonadaceae bacterium]|nr:glycosyltransferase [Sphingomonadaceae bacterium]